MTEVSEWRSRVDTALGRITEGIDGLKEGQGKMCKEQDKLDARVVTLEGSSIAAGAISKWKERFFGSVIAIVGAVVGFLAKVFLK